MAKNTNIKRGRKTAPVKRQARLARSRSIRKTRAPRASRAARPSPTSRTPRVAAADNVPPHFLVIVPGFLGSLLRDRATGKIVWIDFSQVPINPLGWEGWLDQLFTAMRYPNDNLEPAGIVDDVVFAPPWIKQEQYSRLLSELASFGYQANPTRYAESELNVYTFAYDWRQDNRISGRQLGQAIDRWSQFHPGAQPWLLAHSNGGVVSRWYIEKEGGKDHVGRLILLASPCDGAVKGMRMLFSGLNVLFRMQFNMFDIPKRTQQTLRTFPSLYQLIPHQQAFLRGQGDETLDPFENSNWLGDPQQAQLLADAHQFNQDLGNHLSVETLVFFGRKQQTTTSGVVQSGAGSSWDSIQWIDAAQGDGTLPEYSAVFAEAKQNIPVVAGHGDIYVNPALYEMLRWELVDKYKGALRAVAMVQDVTINFNPDRDVYQPGETINLLALVQRGPDQTPVSGAQINVQLTWRQALPGSQPVRFRKRPAVKLVEDPKTSGRYGGQLVAPTVEGYYQLTATVLIENGRPIPLQELIAVETAPAS